jgi:hypothetical protein
MSSRTPPSWVWEWVEREDNNLPPAPPLRKKKRTRRRYVHTIAHHITH